MTKKSKPDSKKEPLITSIEPIGPDVHNEIKREAAHMIQNGLSEVVMGFNPQSTGVQLSQVDTLFKNNRWYLVSNMRQLLSEIYVEHGLIQTVVDVPVDDGLRGGVDIKSKQLSEEQLQELMVSVDREGDLRIAGQACKWNRLFGGAGILIMTDQEPTKPLDIKAIGPDSPLEFRAVDMWELFEDMQNTEGYDAELQEDNAETYTYYSLNIHKSRVMKLKGLTAPSFIRPRLRGWGFSIIEALVRSINQYLKANDLGFEVLDEFKLDIFKIKNFANTLLSPNGAEKIQKRVALANQQKNYQNAIVMDTEDDYLQKQLSFAGLAEAMQGIRLQIASDLRMPLTKVFGISASGFSSGEDDIENYNAMVESQVREKLKYDILKMLELKCQKLFGFIPDDLAIDFKPLRMLSAEQEENVKTQKFNRLLAAKTAGEINTLEFRNAINRGDLLDIQLDTTNTDIQDLASGDEAEKESTPGANREDSAKAAPLKAPTSSLKAKEAPVAKNEGDA